MKKQNTHNNSSIFLMEIILAILFFSLVSAVCLRAFVRSRSMSQDASNLNMAIALTSSIADITQAASSAEDAFTLLSSEYPNIVIKDGSATLYLDDEWQMCSPAADDTHFQIQATPTFGQDSETDNDSSASDGSGLVTWSIQASPAPSYTASTGTDASIYQIEVEVYYAE
jgi:hypothetical protein